MKTLKKITFNNDYTVITLNKVLKSFKENDNQEVYILNENSPFNRLKIQFVNGEESFIPSDLVTIK
jgi:hypothetical protein